MERQCPLSNNHLPSTPELSVTRLSEKQVFDRQALYDLIDEAVIGHVAFIRDGKPVVLGVGIGRDHDSLLIHGSTGSPFFRDMADGRDLAVAITHLDGLVYARSGFESSFNYRSAMVTGSAEEVAPSQKLEALEILMNHMMPGRWEEVRPITKKELAATMILRIPLENASVKISSGPPDEFEDDGDDRTIWAGVLPLRVVAGEPLPSPMTPPGTPVSPSILEVHKKLS